jgi:hypothetical protein
VRSAARPRRSTGPTSAADAKRGSGHPAYPAGAGGSSRRPAGGGGDPAGVDEEFSGGVGSTSAYSGSPAFAGRRDRPPRVPGASAVSPCPAGIFREVALERSPRLREPPEPRICALGRIGSREVMGAIASIASSCRRRGGRTTPRPIALSRSRDRVRSPPRPRGPPPPAVPPARRGRRGSRGRGRRRARGGRSPALPSRRAPTSSRR